MMLPRPDKRHITRTRKYFQNVVPTIKHVLVKSQLRRLKFITEIWANCHTNPTDIEKWKKSFLHLPKGFCAQLHVDEENSSSETTKINERIAGWENGHRGTLWNKVILSKAAKKVTETSSQNENKLLERARTLCHQGFFWKYCKN